MYGILGNYLKSLDRRIVLCNSLHLKNISSEYHKNNGWRGDSKDRN
jgi:hypothetical protein